MSRQIKKVIKSINGRIYQAAGMRAEIEFRDYLKSKNIYCELAPTKNMPVCDMIVIFKEHTDLVQIKTDANRDGIYPRADKIGLLGMANYLNMRPILVKVPLGNPKKHIATDLRNNKEFKYK